MMEMDIRDMCIKNMPVRAAVILGGCLVLLSACSIIRQPLDRGGEIGMSSPSQDSISAEEVLIIMYDAHEGDAPLLQAVRDYPARLVYEYKTLKGIAIAIPAGEVERARAIAYFSRVQGVLSVQLSQSLELHSSATI